MMLLIPTSGLISLETMFRAELGASFSHVDRRRVEPHLCHTRTDGLPICELCEIPRCEDVQQVFEGVN